MFAFKRSYKCSLGRVSRIHIRRKSIDNGIQGNRRFLGGDSNIRQSHQYKVCQVICFSLELVLASCPKNTFGVCPSICETMVSIMVIIPSSSTMRVKPARNLRTNFALVRSPCSRSSFNFGTANSKTSFPMTCFRALTTTKSDA
jgi:hypothetical protein